MQPKIEELQKELLDIYIKNTLLACAFDIMATTILSFVVITTPSIMDKELYMAEDALVDPHYIEIKKGRHIVFNLSSILTSTIDCNMFVDAIRNELDILLATGKKVVPGSMRLCMIDDFTAVYPLLMLKR